MVLLIEIFVLTMVASVSIKANKAFLLTTRKLLISQQKLALDKEYPFKLAQKFYLQTSCSNVNFISFSKYCGYQTQPNCGDDWHCEQVHKGHCTG